MRALNRLPIVLLACASLAAPATAAGGAGDAASAQVVVTAQFGSRTSLTVSSRVLQFDVANPGEPAIAIVDFSAGARTGSGAEVVLSVEPQRAVLGPGGAADVETSLTFAGEGDGTLGGPLDAHAPAVAGRWSGSGLRTGRLVFSLRANAPGRYTLPLRFVLSTP